MSTTPELEAVARAIMGQRIRSDLAFDGEHSVEPETTNTPTDADYDMARAALHAISEPTDGMCDAAHAADDDGSEPFEASFTAAIDHILGETGDE